MNTDYLTTKERKGHKGNRKSFLLEKDDAGDAAFVGDHFPSRCQFGCGCFVGEDFVDPEVIVFVALKLFDEERYFDRVIGEGIAPLLGGGVVANPHFGARVQNVGIEILAEAERLDSLSLEDYPTKQGLIVVVETGDSRVAVVMVEFWHGGNLA